MLTKLNKIQEGFTIVEILIVLAIAALILAIILIAVPDLQRSSRNTNIYHDAQNVVSAINTFEGNNQGSLPNGTASFTGGLLTIQCTGATCATPMVTAAVHVQSGDIIIWNSIASPVPAANSIPVGTIKINQQETCNSAIASSRSEAVYYPIEKPGGTTDSGCSQA